MLIKACRAVHTERCRLMCKQRGRQHQGFFSVLLTGVGGPTSTISTWRLV